VRQDTFQRDKRSLPHALGQQQQPTWKRALQLQPATVVARVDFNHFSFAKVSLADTPGLIGGACRGVGAIEKYQLSAASS
jgi:hypothetical protein